MKLRFALYSLALLCLAGCGTPGAPLPPSLQLPKPVEDLKAFRRGDKVYLTWTAPNATTDEGGIRYQGKIEICRQLVLGVPGVPSCRDKAGELPLPASNSRQDRRQGFTDDISSLIRSNDPRDILTYNVITENDRGKTAGPSNPVVVFLVPSVPPISDLRAESEANAIHLSWTPPAQPPSHRLKTEYALGIDRSSKDTAPVAIGEVPLRQGGFRDPEFTWEQPYTYSVVGVTKVFSHDGKQLAEFEGEPSQPVTITPHDIFPPSAPEGLQAVYSNGFVDLTWHPVADHDIAGYNVYRGQQKLNDKPVVSSVFRDDKLQGVSPGTELHYSVTAVDGLGNESAHSQPATETVPKP
jgi:hypothetical protein